MGHEIQEISLHETAQERYLNYAMSVITSRALPDVRDGLKPVQRRILYTMFQDLKLTHDSKHRKSAAVVGGVMARYHPHGDQSIYDAMVRQAQDFSMRYPLVDGQGNFGSLDGDGAAAMRYTEARLTSLASELLAEIRKKTVEFRDNYDGTTFEPVVLPAQVPNLLINGATGIAVGMATNIPPHNFGEVVDALIALIDKPQLTVADIVREYIQAPDFPTGGVLLEDEDEIIKTYTKGSGTFTVRSDWEVEREDKQVSVVITSIPYTVNKSSLVEKIAEHIIKGKLPQLENVRDESTDDIRIVLELKKGASHAAVMAYLFKHTPLQQRFHANLTCLIPTNNPQVCAPERLNLRQMLVHFLEFRLEVLTRRLRFDLDAIKRRIHRLEAFEIIFDALDEALALIRGSSSKADASLKLQTRFNIDTEQADAILETKLYRLARLEIDAIRDELASKRREAAKIEKTLESERKCWTLVKRELRALRSAYGDMRRTRVHVPSREFEYSEENYIVDEEVRVIVTRDGWFKRQKSYSDLSAIRVRDGDEVRFAMPGNTRGVLVLFSNLGRAYTVRVDDVPQTSGYGDPVQATFDFDDGERIIGAITSHPDVLDRFSSEIVEDASQLTLLAQGEDTSDNDDQELSVQLVAITENGLSARFSLETFLEPSTVKGRLYMKLGKGDTIVHVTPCQGGEIVALATRDGRGMTFMVSDISYYKGAAKGVKAATLDTNDSILDYALVTSEYDGLEVETNRGTRMVVRASLSKFAVASRGNRGQWIIKRGHLTRSHRPSVEILLQEEEQARIEQAKQAARAAASSEEE